jgi:hypothetical protein
MAKNNKLAKGVIQQPSQGLFSRKHITATVGWTTSAGEDARPTSQPHLLIFSFFPVSFFSFFSSTLSPTVSIIHISPNLLADIDPRKRLCPLLNGSRPRDQNPDDTSSFGSTNAPVAASFVNLG